MSYAVLALSSALVLWIVYDFVKSYASAPGTTMARLWAAFENSMTILWGRFVMLVSGLATVLISIAELLNASGAVNAIQTYCKPEYVAGLLVLTLVGSELARRRGLPPKA